MGIRKVITAALIVTADSIGTAAAETTNPQETLEDARRERVERDQRLELDAAEQQRRDKEIVIPTRADPHTLAQSRRRMDMMIQG